MARAGLSAPEYGLEAGLNYIRSPKWPRKSRISESVSNSLIESPE
jgi:hypothetical protein